MTLELKDKKKFVEDKRKEILFCTFDGVDCMDNMEFVINAEFGYCWEFKAEKNKVIAIDRVLSWNELGKKRRLQW